MSLLVSKGKSTFTKKNMLPGETAWTLRLHSIPLMQQLRCTPELWTPICRFLLDKDWSRDTRGVLLSAGFFSLKGIWAVRSDPGLGHREIHRGIYEHSVSTPHQHFLPLSHSTISAPKLQTWRGKRDVESGKLAIDFTLGSPFEDGTGLSRCLRELGRLVGGGG